MLLWNPDPKPDDGNDGALLFVILTLVMWGVVVGVMMMR